MPELDANELIASTRLGLDRLVEETEKKTKLEQERIRLERERIQRQQEILEKERHHNEQLDKLVLIVGELNSLLTAIVQTSLGQLQDRIYRIYRVQESLLTFLLKEYEKILEKERHDATIELRDLLATIKADNHFTVAGTVQSARDVNLGSNISNSGKATNSSTVGNNNSSNDSNTGNSNSDINTGSDTAKCSTAEQQN